MAQDTGFTNPEKLEHTGRYSIELIPRTCTEFVPNATKVEGNIVRVENGDIIETDERIQFYADQSPFSWGYNFLVCIRDEDEALLWQNPDHK